MKKRNDEYYFCPAGEPGNDEIGFLDVAEADGKEEGEVFTSATLKMDLVIKKVERCRYGRHVWAIPVAA